MRTETVKQFYFEMLRIRRVEEKITELYPRQEMRCPVHLCIGQEAVPVGVCGALLREDYVMSNHRSHGHYLAKGGSLKRLMAEVYGKATGCSEGKGGSMHLVDLEAGYLGSTPIVGGTIPIAVGAAFGTWMRDEKRVTVVFFGEAAIEEGIFHEAVNFAVLKKLPVIFICENNLYSVYSPMSVRQPAGREVFEVARGLGVESLQGDGNNVLEVWERIQPAVQKAREGKGPTFLEFKTYRWREHCGASYDNQLGYRTEAEFEVWKKRCPIERLRQELVTKKIVGEEELRQMLEQIDNEIEEAVAFAEKSPFPEASRLTEDIYA